MTREELQSMEPDAVKKIANDLGAKFHHKAGPDKVIDAVLLKLAGSDEGEDATEIEQPAPPAPVATQTFTPPITAIPVTMEPGKIQLAAIIAKEKSEWPTVEQVTEALRSHVARGMQIVQLIPDYWHFRMGQREASGNMKMPLKQVLMQANILMTPTKKPTEN